MIDKYVAGNGWVDFINGRKLGRRGSEVGLKREIIWFILTRGERLVRRQDTSNLFAVCTVPQTDVHFVVGETRTKGEGGSECKGYADSYGFT